MAVQHYLPFPLFYLMERKGRDRMGCVYKRDWWLSHASHCCLTVIGRSAAAPRAALQRDKKLSEHCYCPMLGPFLSTYLSKSATLLLFGVASQSFIFTVFGKAPPLLLVLGFADAFNMNVRMNNVWR